MKILAWSSREIDKWEYLADEEILLFNQMHIIEQAKFEYSSLGKAFEEQTEKQIDVIESLGISNLKKHEFNQIEGIFQQHLMNDLIRAKLK